MCRGVALYPRVISSYTGVIRKKKTKVPRVVTKKPLFFISLEKTLPKKRLVTLAALYLIAWLSNIDLPLSHVASVGEVGESTLA